MISVSREVALSRMPTRLSNGEGRTKWGSNRQVHPFRSAGVVGTARWKDTLRTEGDPSGRRQLQTSRFARWTGRESERAIVLTKPGNAGGGKGPHFWNALRSGRG
jgi:hypothetical protein